MISRTPKITRDPVPGRFDPEYAPKHLNYRHKSIPQDWSGPKKPDMTPITARLMDARVAQMRKAGAMYFDKRTGKSWP